MPCIFSLAFSLFLAGVAPAQTSSAPPDTPPLTSLPAGAPLNPALPTLFLVGDSTARNGAGLGWGDHLAPLFDTTRINVAHRARAGPSSAPASPKAGGAKRWPR